MRFALPVFSLLFLLPCLSAAMAYPTTGNASFYDSCLLYYEPHGSFTILDQDGIPAGFCNDINTSDALFRGTVHSDTTFLRSTSSEPDSNGWVTEHHKLVNMFRVRIDSVIKGQFVADTYVDLGFLKESSSTRSRFLHVDAQGRSMYEGEMTMPPGFWPDVPEMAVGLKAIFLVRQDDSLVTPVMVGRQEVDCMNVFEKCLGAQKR